MKLTILIVQIAIAIGLSMIVNSCSFQRSTWLETSDGSIRYSQLNVVPPFGSQSESAGQMSNTKLDDGTRELTIGRTDKGNDNTAQVQLMDAAITAAVQAAIASQKGI